jgi:hypothetical protein
MVIETGVQYEDDSLFLTAFTRHETKHGGGFVSVQTLTLVAFAAICKKLPLLHARSTTNPVSSSLLSIQERKTDLPSKLISASRPEGATTAAAPWAETA